MAKEKPLSEYDAKPVLDRLETLIDRGISRPIREVCDDLSIFDWWPDRLTIRHMKQMRTFLKLAIELGYSGYVCFKVGASGCANGMWAHKRESTNGYSPDGEAIYRSFSPDYTYYSYRGEDGQWHPNQETDEAEYDSLKSPRALKEALSKGAPYARND